jgi:hypothetical protein
VDVRGGGGVWDLLLRCAFFYFHLGLVCRSLDLDSILTLVMREGPIAVLVLYSARVSCCVCVWWWCLRF